MVYTVEVSGLNEERFCSIHRKNVTSVSEKAYRFFCLRHYGIKAASCGDRKRTGRIILHLSSGKIRISAHFTGKGKDAKSRQKDVETFWKSGTLNPDSNVQFGEGGAGTFSDGKLNTLVKDKLGRSKFVLETFVTHGAPRTDSV